MADIFALWTISKAEVDEEDRTVSYDYKPHPAQISAIMLILSIVSEGKSDKPKSVANCMAQVGTGEGKSVVLAGLSSFLALVGFEVNCACYSVYLSERDRAAFKGLFELLEIHNKISYGTFNEVC